MATTTNFGWETPDDTDLVKDGAAAMRTLGSSIDTSFVDLKGGTTGQVLSKASNTDLDFSWVAQDDSNAIQNAIVDAKGDIISATAADTPARLAVGTNGQILTVDSSTATGLKWAAPAGGGKMLQVVTATNSTQKQIASTTFTDTNLTCSITPTSATSRIMVIISQSTYVQRSASQADGGIRIMRDSTEIFLSNQNALNWYQSATTDGATGGYTSISYIDSPATTSAITYKTQGRVATTANSCSFDFQKSSSTSTIILIEVGA